MLRKYFQDFVNKHLEAYVEHFDESSLDIGLWDGDVHLSNLVLKGQEWQVSPGIWVELVYGVIDRIQVQVPWMELRAGGLRGNIENCSLVLKLKSSEYDDEHTMRECLLFADKMNRLDKQEQKLLLSTQESWVSRTMGSLSSRYLAQLATGFSLHIQNLQCSFLVPNSDEYDHTYVHILTSFEALDVGQLNAAEAAPSDDASQCFFSKEVSLRGLSVRVGQREVECSTSKDDFEALFDQLDASDMLVNPIHIELQLKGEHRTVPETSQPVDDRDIAASQQSAKVIDVSIRINNFEATPKVEQLQILKTAAEHVQMEQARASLRAKFLHMHPLFTAARLNPQLVTSSRHGIPRPTPRELWRYAFHAVVFLNREANSTAPAEVPAVRKARYVALYEKLLQAHLPEQRARLDEADCDATPVSLTDAEKRQLDDTHLLASLEDLCGFRAAAHKSLRSYGVTIEELSAAVSSLSITRIRPTAPGDDADTSIMTVEEEEAEVRALQDPKLLSWDVKVSISRFAVAILSSASQAESLSLQRKEHSRAFTVLLYGLEVERQAIRHSESLRIAVGSVRAYGLNSHEIFLCGGEPDRWLQPAHEADAHDEAQDPALSLTYKILDTRREDEASEPGRDDADDDKNSLIKLAVAKIHVHWHQASMNFLRDLGDTVVPGAAPNLEEAITQKQRRVELVREATTRESFNQRWNLKASLEGMQFSILPNFERSDSSPLLSTANAENRVAILRVGRIFARGGDYTQLWLDSSRDGAGEVEIEEDVLRTTVRAIRSASVNTFVYNVDSIEVLLVEDLAFESEADVKITRIPWSLSGALSTSKKTGDERYPDVRVDVLCSQLDLILSVASTITLIGSANQVIDTLSASARMSDNAHSLSGKQPRAKQQNFAPHKPSRLRIKRLAPLGTFSLNVRFSASNIALTSDQPNVDHLSFAESILRAFAAQIVVRGELSQVMETKRRLLVVQLQKLDMREKDANLIIDGILHAIRDDESIDDAVAAAMTKIAELTQDIVRLRNTPIVEVHLGKCKIALNQLTYDYKVTVDVRKLLVTGPSQIPLFQILRVGGGLDKKKKEETGRRGRKGAAGGGRPSFSESKEDAEEAERATLGFSLEYIESDAGYHFGEPEPHSTMLSAAEAFMNSQSVQRRDGQLRIRVDTVNLLLPSDIIPVIGSLIYASNRIKRYLETLRMNRLKSTETFATHLERRNSESHDRHLYSGGEEQRAGTGFTAQAQAQAQISSSLNHLPRPRNASLVAVASPPAPAAQLPLNLTLILDVRSVDVALSHDENLLALVVLGKGHVELNLDLSVTSGKFAATFATLRLFDLSEVGSLHPLMVWPKTDSAMPVIDVSCFIECENPQRRTVTLDAKLVGLRVCLLYRFLQELVQFVSLMQSRYADMIDAIQQEQQASGALDIIKEVEEEKEEGFAEEEEEDEFSDDSSSDSDGGDDASSSYTSSSADSDVEPQSHTPFRNKKQAEAAQSDFLQSPGPNQQQPSVYVKKNDAQEDLEKAPAAISLRWKFHLSDFVLVCPRNSSSIDLVALTVAHGTIGNMYTSATWQAPTAQDVQDPVDRKQPLYFNPYLNSWTKKEDHAHNCSMSSFDLPLVSEYSSSSLGTDSPYNDARYHSAHKSFSHVPGFGTPHSADKQNSSGDSSESSPSSPSSPEPDGSAESISRMTISLESVNIFISLSGPLVNYEHTGEVLVDTGKVKDFFEIHDGQSVWFIKHKKRAADTSGISGARGSQYWRKVSLTPFHLLVVVDHVEAHTRILISDTDVLSSLALNLTMAELYLLESVWFDNIFEAPMFFVHRRVRGDDPDELEASEDEALRRDDEASETHSSHSSETPASSVSEANSQHKDSAKVYGTRDYLRGLRGLPSIGELVLVRAEIRLECFMDVDYFMKESPALKFLRAKEVMEMLREDGSKDGRWAGHGGGVKLNSTCQNYALPVAVVAIEGLVLHQRSTTSGSEMCLGAGLVEIFDTRMPKASVYDRVLRVGTLEHAPGEEVKRIYGYGDFDFGLKLNPSDVSTNGDIPLKLSMSNTDFWTTTNVGLDGLELNLRNLELIWLVVDFFACYFQYPEFGHPLVAAYQKMPEGKIPYRGVDTRVFATRPQICIMENPLLPSSATLVLESAAGVFYRQIIDNQQSARVEVKLLDVALVAHQRFGGHDRRLRGSAGSGTGIRTLIENLDCDYSHHYIASLGHMDVQFSLLENSSLSPADYYKSDETPSAEGAVDLSGAPPTGAHVPEGAADYTDLEAERLTLRPVQLFVPKCNKKFSNDVKLMFPERCCNVVTSYEDLLFAINLISEFIGISTDSDDKAGGKKNNKEKSSKEKEKEKEKKKKATDAKTPPMSLFAVVIVYGVRIIVVDNVLGLHLPLLQIFLKELAVNFDKSYAQEPEPQPQVNRRRSWSKSIENTPPSITVMTSESAGDEDAAGDSQRLKAYGKIHVWSDYFNNLKKCWEPLLEKLIANVLFENSSLYGQGITVRSETALHLNISGAFFRTLNDLIRMYQSAEAPHNARQGENPEPRQASRPAEETLVSNRLERKMPPVQWCPVLQEGARFGFALQNSTGQPIRFMQQKDGGNNTITSFIDDGERGALNFVATTTRIRNDVIVRDAFNVQQDRVIDDSSAAQERVGASQSRTKKSLCLQISGYKAISSVEADELGVKYEDLIPIDNGRREKRESLLKAMDGKVQNALKLVAEVVSLNRGRLLHLRSVFSVKNNTSHTIEILAREGSVQLRGAGDRSATDAIFSINSGGNMYVPLALLQRSSAMHNGKALGLLKVRPATLKPVEDELGTEREDIQIGMDIEYSGSAIDLYDVVKLGDSEWFEANGDERVASIGASGTGHVQTDISQLQLCCQINPKLKKKSTLLDVKNLLQTAAATPSHFNKLPLFTYNIEIQRVGDLETTAERSKAKLGVIQAAFTGRLFTAKEDRPDAKMLNPVHYNIIIHPPIVLESMLPWHAHFEILHANTSRLLWSSLIEPGMAKPIHTVTLDEPLRLRIHLKYCRTGNPCLFHTPHEENSGRTFVGTINNIQKTVEGFLVETESGEDASVLLADSMGQRLRLNIENVEGGGGERHIVVYCPYWIVNTSQYCLRIREEGAPKDQLPAGSVTPTKDGTRPVAYGSVKQWPEQMGRDTIFPGKVPPLHASHRENGQIPNDDPLRNMLLDLPFEEIVKFAYMYNYPDGHVLGKRRVCVQIDDSEWSQGFSLDSVGAPIPLSIEDPDKGLLELGYKIKVAPGRLGKYTKIVRFMPRFVIMNRLEMNIKLLQPTGFVGELCEMDVKARHFRPFHLPALFGERSLAIEVEGPWNRTVFFEIEAIGTSTLRVLHRLDLGALPHVNTRGLPDYEVSLRPEDDVGIWFETDWEEKNIVVKTFRPGSFAHEETDIQIGDVLIGYNFYTVDPKDPFYDKDRDRFIKVTGRDFEKVMRLMKERDSTMRIMIRTVEENIRLLRKDARDGEVIARATTNSDEFPDEIALRLELRQVEATVFIVVDAVDKEVRSEYMLENNSVSHVIHYKQKGVTGNNWCSLVPGQSLSYIWEDPFKPHKLLLKAGRNMLSPKSSSQVDSDFFPGDVLNRTHGVIEFITGVAADEVTVVSLDEIGTKDREIVLPNGAEGKLYASVNIKNGATKTLVISTYQQGTNANNNSILDKEKEKARQKEQQLLELTYSGLFLKVQWEALSMLHSRFLVALQQSESILLRTGQHANTFCVPMLAKILQEVRRKQDELRYEFRRKVPDLLLSSYLPFESLWGQRVEKKHQVLVEILEAKDLKQFVIGKLEDTYCSVQLRAGHSIFQGQAQPRYTNICEQNMNPVWIGQRFVFDVPDFDDVNTIIKARDVKIRVNVMSKTVIRPLHRFLGQADIQFSCLKTSAEEEVKGYFLLRPQAASITAAQMIDVSGSIKIRLQWIHSDEGLLKYNLASIAARIAELEELGRVQAKLQQQAEAQAAEKLDTTVSVFQEKSRGLENINVLSFAQGTLSLAGGIAGGTLSLAGGTLSLAGGLAGATLRLPGDVLRGLIRKSNIDDSSNKETQPQVLTVENFEPTKAEVAVGGATEGDDGGRKKEKKPPAPPRPRAATAHKFVHQTLHSPHPNMALSENPDQSEAANQMLFRSRRSTHYEMVESLMNQKQPATSPLEDPAARRARRVARNTIVSKVMERRPETIRESEAFVTRCEEECRSSYNLVHTMKGRLAVTPRAAHNIPAGNKKVSVRITYGENIHNSVSKANSADLNWSSDDANIESPLGTAIFDLETLEIKSSLLIQVMAHGIRKKKEIARLEIPVFNLLDCICRSPPRVKEDRERGSTGNIDDNVYEMWFALLPTEECVEGEGDTEGLGQRHDAEQADYMEFSKGGENKPCIQLRFRLLGREEIEGKDSESYLFFRLQLPSFSIAIIDSANARELMQCSMRGTDFRHAVSKKFILTSLNVMWVQVDNQLPDPISPIVLSPSLALKFPEPTLRINIRKDNELSREGLTSYDFIVVKVRTFDLSLEQQTVVASWALIKNWFHEKATSQPEDSAEKTMRRDSTYNDLDMLGFATCKDGLQYDLSDLLPALASSDGPADPVGKAANKNKLYIAFIKISPLMINVSFIMNPKLQHTTQKVMLQEASWNDDFDLLSSVTFFLSRIGVVALDLTSSISDAPIKFSAFESTTIFETDTEVEKRLRQHYLFSALTQLYKIVGSLELVGNPVGLVTSLGIGVQDFFYEPYHAFTSNPTDIAVIGKLGRGVVKGTLSIVSNTTEGMIGTGTTFTRAVGRGFAKLAMDPSYMVAREELQRQPRTTTEAMTRPLRDIGNGVYYGVVGLVKVPYNSFRRHRAYGIVPGIAKGMAGFFAKPVVGVLDAITHTGDVIREVVRAISREQQAPVNRIRLRNQFGPDGRMLPYSYPAALGMLVAQALDRSRLESMGNAINESVGFLTSMGRVFGSCGRSSGETRRVLVQDKSRRLSISQIESPGRLRSAGSGSFDLSDTSFDPSDDKGPDLGGGSAARSEFVIHTFMKKNNRSAEKKKYESFQLVIVTSARVLVADYIKKKRGNSTFIRRWEADMRYLKTPVLQRRKAGGYLLVLGSTKTKGADETLTSLVKGPMNYRWGRRKGEAEPLSDPHTTSDFTIESTLTEDDGSVLELYNCIAIRLRHWALEVGELEQTKIQFGVVSYGENLECDEEGIFKIGPWEYSNAHFDSAEQELEQRNAHLASDLEATSWHLVRAADRPDPSRVKPLTWLEEERRACIAAHATALLEALKESIPSTGSEESFSSRSEEGEGVSGRGVQRGLGYLSGGLSSMGGLVASSVRSLQSAVTALSPAVGRQSVLPTSTSGTLPPMQQTSSAEQLSALSLPKSGSLSGSLSPRAGGGSSLSPKSIMVTSSSAISPKNGDGRKKGISFAEPAEPQADSPPKDDARQLASPFSAMVQPESPIPHVSSPGPNESASLPSKLFSPFPDTPAVAVPPSVKGPGGQPSQASGSPDSDRSYSNPDSASQMTFGTFLFQSPLFLSSKIQL